MVIRMRLIAVAAALVVSPWVGLADEPARATPPVPQTRALAAEWEYSRDGGKTFSPRPPAGAPAMQRDGVVPLVFKGTFEIDDPTKVAGFWVRIAEPGDSPKASICDGDLTAASGGYWKDLGFCPTLLNARATLNGQRVATTRGPMLYFWLPIQGDPVKGKNTLELAGDCYTYWGDQPAGAITAHVIAAEAQPTDISNGPVLGDFGDGYFTLACRTRMPAELIVEATPTDPPGKAIVAHSPKGIWHRVRIELPKGTKAAAYSVAAKVGRHETTRGPFAVAFPGETFRFAAFGNVLAHSIFAKSWAAYSDQILKSSPAFVVNTGNCSEHATWEFDLESQYFAPAAKLWATKPTLLTPCYRDFAGAIQELHDTPAADGYSHTWSKAIGPIRFIGLDGGQVWKAGEPNVLWLEKELADAKEKFVFVLNAYPAYSSGKNSNKARPLPMQSREVIMPLLAKYKATAMLSGMDPDYERCEPTPDKGVTQIVAGAAGKDAYRFSGSAMALNPFAKGKGRDWAGADGGVRSFCVFDVRAGEVEMTVHELTTEAVPRVLDKKTFLPR